MLDCAFRVPALFLIKDNILWFNPHVKLLTESLELSFNARSWLCTCQHQASWDLGCELAGYIILIVNEFDKVVIQFFVVPCNGLVDDLVILVDCLLCHCQLVIVDYLLLHLSLLWEMLNVFLRPHVINNGDIVLNCLVHLFY